MWVILVFLTLLAVVMVAWLLRNLIFLASLLIGGAQYVVIDRKNLRYMLKLAQLKAGSGQLVADLGSGSGEIVIAAAQAGALQVVGFEINPLLVWQSRRAVQKQGLNHHTEIRWADVRRVDLSKFDVVFIYGTGRLMRDLEPKLRRELRPGTVVVAKYFEFADWPAEQQLGEVRRYRVEAASHLG